LVSYPGGPVSEISCVRHGRPPRSRPLDYDLRLALDFASGSQALLNRNRRPHRRRLARANSARNAFVARALRMASSAAASSATLASWCSDRNSIHSIVLKLVMNL
jgi:hypothetical protein